MKKIVRWKIQLRVAVLGANGRNVNMNKTEKVLEHLKEYGSITSMERLSDHRRNAEPKRRAYL